MMKRTIHSCVFLVLPILLYCYITIANAWTDDVASLKDINTICKLEPEAQCTSAIRIGLNAPGVDMHNSSMTTMRLDNANLQGADLSNSILQLTSLKGANLMFANLHGAHMHAVSLVKANLMMANLSKANLLDADLSHDDTGASVLWHESYWAFIGQYLHTYAGDDYVLSAEQSLDLLTGNTALPSQLLIANTRKMNRVVKLPRDLSLSLFTGSQLPSEPEQFEGVRIYPLEVALVKVVFRLRRCSKPGERSSTKARFSADDGRRVRKRR